MKFWKRTVAAMAALGTAAAGLMAGPGGLAVPAAGASGARGKVTLTWWTWMADTPSLIKMFEKAHPNISIAPVPNYGSGTPFYNKLTTALAAGSAPCMTQVEYDHLPQFANDMTNIAKYDTKYKRDFPSWLWNEVDQNGKLLSIPGDIGPMGMMYQPAVFKKYNLPLPTTYATFASDAVKLHKDNPKMYLTYFPPGDQDYLEALFWQAGAFPYSESPSGTWTVNLDGPIEKKVVNYWAKLIKEGAIAPVTDETPEWNHQVSTDTYAVYLGAAWYPAAIDSYISPKHPQTFAVTAMPQWKAGANADANWGGSSYGVTKDCPAADVKDAAMFVAYMNTAPSALKFLENPVGADVYPADIHRASVSQFSKPTPNFIGNINEEFAKLSSGVPTKFQWSPWDTELGTYVSTQFGAAAAGKQTWLRALQQVQSNLVGYAKSAGYSVQS